MHTLIVEYGKNEKTLQKKYIEENYATIEADMNGRNSTSKRKLPTTSKTRKKREELSVSASKSIKKESVEIIVKFD